MFDSVPVSEPNDNLQQARHWLGIAKQSLDQDHRAVKFIAEAMHYIELEERKKHGR